MTAKYLLTGVTGGLGAKILDDMLNVHSIPPQSIIATSRSEANKVQYEARGLQFRVADFNDPFTLDSAFKDVENLLFMSSSTRDTPTRNREHANVVEAAKKADVKKVWYVSLAFGGYANTSTISFQQAHYETENLLKQSGLDFISLRAGVYTDAFPLFLNWYPSSPAILMPELDPPVSESMIAFTTRAELGEAMATLLAKGLEALPKEVQPQGPKHIILLTGPKAESLFDIAGAISRGLGEKVPVWYLQPKEWIEASAKDDVGGKPRAWFESRLDFTRSVIAGDAETVGPALEVLLGRKPETGMEGVERLVREDKGYTWHQNHAR